MTTLVNGAVRLHFGRSTEGALAAEAEWHLGGQSVLVSEANLRRAAAHSPWELRLRGLWLEHAPDPVLTADPWAMVVACWVAIGHHGGSAMHLVTTPGMRALLRIGPARSTPDGTAWPVLRATPLGLLLPDDAGVCA